jgi:AraC family transcriptional regulator
VTPEDVRHHGRIDSLTLQPPIVVEREVTMNIDPPRFVDGDVLLLAGIAQRYQTGAAGANIPEQWQRFTGYLGGIRGQVGEVTYGVCYNSDDEGAMDYLCSVAVRDFADLPAEFTRLRLGPQRYVVFWHPQHVSAIRRTWNVIWNEWLPSSGHRAADAPLFERYDTRFNPRTGGGGVELWVPIE